jgi:hypothetical protein
VVVSDRRFVRSVLSLAARSTQKARRGFQFAPRPSLCATASWSIDPVRMGQGHAKTHGAAVILHVKRVARERQRFGEVSHNLGVVIERIREFLRVGPVAVSEARVIGRDKVIAIGKPGEERLEHPRRRGKSVQQEKRRRVFGAALSVKDGESIYSCRAIKSRVFHGTAP